MVKSLRHFARIVHFNDETIMNAECLDQPLSQKTLLIVRHAKSSWKDDSLADRDRPLNRRGRADAPEMGRRLKHRALVPDVIISSPALRALLTAQAIAHALDFPQSRIVVEEDLYGCTPQDLIDTAALIDASYRVAMLVSHNPAVTELANVISRKPIDNVPTCGILTLVAGSWGSIASAELTDFDFPKSMRYSD